MKRYVKRGNKIFKVNDKDDKKLIAEYNKKENKIKLYHNSSLYSKDKIYNLFRFSYNPNPNYNEEKRKRK